MTLRKASTIRAFDQGNVSNMNDNLDRLFSVKLEGRWHLENSATATVASVYQSMETGEVDFSATGSPTIVRSFGLGDKHGRILFATAHAKNSLVSAHVTDVTQTGITITCRTISGTGNFSQVTTATVKVYFQIVGSSP